MSPSPSDIGAKVAVQAAGSSTKEFKKESTVARFTGAGTAGIAELIVFHPVRRTQCCMMFLSPD